MDVVECASNASVANSFAIEFLTNDAAVVDEQGSQDRTPFRGSDPLPVFSGPDLKGSEQPEPHHYLGSLASGYLELGRQSQARDRHDRECRAEDDLVSERALRVLQADIARGQRAVGRAGDAASWTNMTLPPNTPIDIAANAHLIKHGDTWMLFDTSTSDAYATHPAPPAKGAGIQWIKTPEQTMTA